MKILHLGSFVGNFGDVYSNQGLYDTLESSDIPCDVECIEIRRMYENYRGADKIQFDEVIDYFERGPFDRLIVGGGGFFDYWLSNTNTGTTFQVDYRRLEKSKKHIVFSSIGAFPHKPIPSENYKKFENFLSNVCAFPFTKVIFRNDGTHSHLRNTFGAQLVSALDFSVDHAFLMSLPECQNDGDDEPAYICLNVSHDQLSLFDYESPDPIEPDSYYKKLAEKLTVESERYHLKFVPHLHVDYLALANLIKYVDPWVLRNKWSVTAYQPSNFDLNEYLRAYAGATHNFCSRYHSCVASISSGVETTIFGVLPRARYLAREFLGTNLLDREMLTSSTDTGQETFTEATRDHYRERLLENLVLR